jgi:hypothetical protein
MTTRSLDRTGFLIVRLWIEGNPRDGLRARIMQTLDSTGNEQAMSTAASPEEIYAAVKTWVETIVDQNADPPIRSPIPIS